MNMLFLEQDITLHVNEIMIKSLWSFPDWWQELEPALVLNNQSFKESLTSVCAALRTAWLQTFICVQKVWCKVWCGRWALNQLQMSLS